MPPTDWKISNDRKYTLTASKQEITECNSFTINATKNPTLNQFLFDFNFFRLSEQLTKNDYGKIINLMEQMRAYNTYLKLYTPTYYRLNYEIVKTMATLETYAEQYEALCLRIAESEIGVDATNDKNQLLTISNNIEKLLTEGTLYKDLLLLYSPAANKIMQVYNPTTGGFRDLAPQYLSIWDDLSTKATQYDELYEDTVTELNNLIDPGENLDPLNPKRLAYDQKKAELESKRDTYQTLKTKWGDDNSNPGKYSLMLGYLVTYLDKYLSEHPTKSTNLTSIIAHFEHLNNLVISQLYSDYGQYIYESTYSNTDELDSYGLYEQAIHNFELIKKPAATYNLSMIDLNMLEEVDIPNIQLDAKIRVYESKLNLNDNELNSVQYTNNEVTITGISYTLRNPGDVSLTIEKKNTTDILLEKLLLSVRR